MKTIFVYGSLKKGFYNHVLIEKDIESKFLFNHVLNNFEMYNLGSYPCIVKSDNKKDNVIGEVYEISDDTFNKITRMEFSAGYYMDYIIVDNKVIFYYYMSKETLKNYYGKDSKKIESGIWSK